MLYLHTMRFLCFFYFFSSQSKSNCFGVMEFLKKKKKKKKSKQDCERYIRCHLCAFLPVSNFSPLSISLFFFFFFFFFSFFLSLLLALSPPASIVKKKNKHITYLHNTHTRYPFTGSQVTLVYLLLVL